MSLPPEEELFVLLDAEEEGRFELGEPQDYHLLVGRPGLSPSLDGILELANKGYVTIVEEWDEAERRDFVWARITEEGRARARSLLLRGVEPKPARL
jgi:hypothetical protein